jgi:hypothetical protein
MALFLNADTEAAAAILQQDYLPGIQAQLNSATVLSDRLQRVPKHKFRGNQVQLAAHTTRGVTQTVSGQGAGDSLPPLSKQGFTTVTFDVKELAHRIGVSAIGLARTEDAPEGAFVDLLEVEMMGAKDDFMQERNRQWFGDTIGGLALVGSTNSVAQLTVQVDSTRFIREGEPIALVSNVNGTGGTVSQTTVNVILSGTLFSVDVAVDATINAHYVVHRNGSTALVNTDQFGLASVVHTANQTITFGNVDRTINRFWQGNILGNAGTNRTLSSALLKQGLNLAWRRGGKPTLGITNDAVMLEYGAILAADKRYPGEFVTLDGGWEALSFASTPIVADKDATANALYWLNEPDLMIAEKGQAQFEDRDGSIFFRVADRHQFEVLLYCFSNLVATRCNSHTRISDITEDFQTHNL